MNVSKNRNIYRVFFSEYEDYEDMESLFDKFKNELNAIILNRIDGPYSRIWIISINNLEYELHIDESYGSSIIAKNKLSRENLKSLLPNIERFIN